MSAAASIGFAVVPAMLKFTVRMLVVALKEVVPTVVLMLSAHFVPSAA